MGTLYGIGLGPGDPELITVKGARLIRSARLVFVPVRSDGGVSYARSIAASYLDPDTQAVVELEHPFVRERARLEAAWAASAAEIAGRLPAEGHAVFLTEGDPLLYSTFTHIYRALRRRHPYVNVEIVPGVSSFAAAAAVSQTPLATADEPVCIIPVTADHAELCAVLERGHTVVFLKVSTAFDLLLDALEQSGRISDAVWVRRAGRPEQEIVHDIGSLRGQRPDYFSLVIVPASGQ